MKSSQGETRGRKANKMHVLYHLRQSNFLSSLNGDPRAFKALRGGPNMSALRRKGKGHREVTTEKTNNAMLTNLFSDVS